ncbi:MAG: arylsulfatase, partial [Planctomycetota bacterium]
AQRANIILILADDLGYGDLGCYGQTIIATPNLDRMAAEGMRFTQFYAGSTVCAPSRSVLMTGQHLGHTRVRGNAAPEGAGPQMLHNEDITVAEVLKKAGYATGLIGKWGLGMPGDEGVPNNQGFDYFFGFLSQHHAHNHYPDYLWRNDAKVALPNVVTPVGTDGGGYATERVQYAGDLFAEESLGFVERNKDQPFFLYYAVTVPHANNERFRELGDGQEVPDYGQYADKDWVDPDKGQAAMITRLDAQVGTLIEKLKQLGLDERTIIFFSSDNGPHREGGNNPEFFDASGPVRGLKRSLTDGGIRVPMIVRWPDHVPPGVVNRHVGYFGDMMATFAELAGAPLPPDRDSISLVPTLVSDASKPGAPAQQQHEYLYWEFHEYGFDQAVLLGGRWKGIRLWNKSAPIELYDLTTDLGENYNVAGKHLEIVKRVSEIMDTAHVTVPDWPIREAPYEASLIRKMSRQGGDPRERK